MLAELLCTVSVFTAHYGQAFHTQCAVEVNAPSEAADKVIEQLIYDFQYDFEHLFDWAFSGLGKQNNEERDALLLASRAITYKPDNDYGSITIDVIVPGFVTIPGIYVDGIIRDIRGSGEYSDSIIAGNLPIDSVAVFSRRIYIETNSTGKLFEKAYGNLYVIPVDAGHFMFLMDINIQFKWFLRMFVTERVWRNTMQWRAIGYMNNLKRAAESY